MCKPVVGSSIWVAVDASNIGCPRGGKGVLDMSPAGWCVACLLLWIVAFPCYLAKRGDLVRQADAARHPGPMSAAPVVPGMPGGPPPGYWQASDGQWYLPQFAPLAAPAPPPAHPAADGSPGPCYWKAADGHWYPPTITPPAPTMLSDPRPAEGPGDASS